MKNQSRLLVSLMLTVAMLQGCANAGEVKAAAKPAAKSAEGWSGDTIPTTVTKSAAVASTGAQTTAPSAAAQATAPTAASADKLVTQYKVVAGDTLAKVAARKEIYDNATWWPLLYRSNSNIIGPQGLIYPGQVLAVPRNQSSAEIDAMLNRPHKPSKVVVAKPQAKAASAAVAAKTTPAAPVKPVTADATAPAVAAVPVSLVSAARRAFSAGDIPWAEYYYNVHLTQHSRDVRAWGELGNVYYFDGELPESAQAYYNAANIMIDQGRVGAAVQLLPAIDEGNPELAQALYDRLSSIQ